MEGAGGVTLTRSVPILVGVSLVACDPGGMYDVPGRESRMKDGKAYNVETFVPGVTAWVSTGYFTSSLSVQWEIANTSLSPVTVELSANVKDAHGDNVKAYPALSPHSNCRADGGEAVVVLPSQTCKFENSFEVQPLVHGWLLMRTNPVLERLTVSLYQSGHLPLARATFVRTGP